MAALLVERSFIDLRSQVTVNGVCSIAAQDVKCLLSDHVRAKVWCACLLSFSLWYVPLSWKHICWLFYIAIMGKCTDLCP